MLLGCSSNNPKDVAEDFSKELAKGEFKKAASYCTPESGAVLEMLDAIGKEQTGLVDPGFKFKYLSETVDENNAEVFYKDQNGEERSVKLVKWDDKWKVIMMF